MILEHLERANLFVDLRFAQIDAHSYQSPDYELAANRVNINVKSGAGAVSVITK